MSRAIKIPRSPVLEVLERITVDLADLLQLIARRPRIRVSS
jgi:hypothetical protein